MSTVTRPRGPLPARVYWTRRLVLLTLVVLVAWLMSRWLDGGSGAAQPEDETPAAATQTDDVEESTTQERKGDRERKDRIRTVAESFDRPREDCDLTNVRVVPSVADPVYSGEPVQLTMRVSSTGSKACSLRVNADHLLVAITAGRDLVWDSTKCDDAVPARDLALHPRWWSLLDITWSGRYSGRHCAPDASVAEPGTYTVEAAVLEGEPSEVEFEVVDRPESDDEQSEDEQSEDESDTDEPDADESENDDAKGQDADEDDPGSDGNGDKSTDERGRGDTGRG
jgi:hypothetical protein